VELNLEIKRLEAQVVKATEMLQSTKDTNSTNT
jgi:hypothetical protein